MRFHVLALCLLSVLLSPEGSANAESLFRDAQVISTDPYPSVLAVGDLTGDGRDDAAVGPAGNSCSDPTSCSILVLPQAPSGLLTGPLVYPTWPVEGLVVGDFNGDGRDDLASSDGGDLQVYLQDSTGALLPPADHQPMYGIFELAAGDLNDDGREDIASIPSGGYGVDLFLQTPAGGLRHESIELPGQEGHQDLLIADLDGDGRDDLLLFAGGQPRLTFLYQKPAGGFTAPTSLPLEPGTYHQAAAVGNLDADSLPEILVSAVRPGQPQPFRLQLIDQATPRVWSSGPLLGPGDVSSIVIEDLDGDGLSDVAALDRTGSVVVWRQPAAGTLALEQRYPLPIGNYAATEALAVGDLNGDGLPDLAVASDNAGLVLLLQRNENPAPPPGPWLSSTHVPGFEFQVRITGGPIPIAGTLEPGCIPETACVSGALPGRSEVFVRVVGPKPNGKLWPTLVKFSTSEVEVWIRQLSTGALRYYRLAGARPGFDELPGLFDRNGFEP